MSSGLTKKVHKMNYNPALDKATKNGNNRSSRNHPFDADEMEERQMNEQWAAYQDSKAFADRVATLYGAEKKHSPPFCAPKRFSNRSTSLP